MKTVIIYKLGFNANYYSFTLILPIKIVMCSKFLCTKFISYNCFGMRLDQSAFSIPRGAGQIVGIAGDLAYHPPAIHVLRPAEKQREIGARCGFENRPRSARDLLSPKTHLGRGCSGIGIYLTENVPDVVSQKSIPPQIRQRILYCY